MVVFSSIDRYNWNRSWCRFSCLTTRKNCSCNNTSSNKCFDFLHDSCPFVGTRVKFNSFGTQWVKKVFVRNGGATKGQSDRYWFSPKEKYKLRSLVQVRRFLTALAENGGDEIKAKKAIGRSWDRRKRYILFSILGGGVLARRANSPNKYTSFIFYFKHEALLTVYDLPAIFVTQISVGNGTRSASMIGVCPGS